jgi:hypothetical protein
MSVSGRSLIFFALVALSAFLPATAFGRADETAPEPYSFLNKQVWLETTNGFTVWGELTWVDGEKLEIVNADGITIQIDRDRVKSIVRIAPSNERRLPPFDAASNRLLLLPTAFPLAQGQLLVSNTDLVSVSASYGITNNFSLWGGATPIGTAISGRFSFELINGVFGVSMGSYVFFNPLGSMTDFVVPFAITSIGSGSFNLTVGLGGIFTMTTNLPISFDFVSVAVVLGGIIPLSSTVGILTENWLLLPYDTLYYAFDQTPTCIPILVVRISGSRLSWDFGLALPFTFGPTGQVIGLFGPLFPLPVLGLTYRIS